MLTLTLSQLLFYDSSVNDMDRATGSYIPDIDTGIVTSTFLRDNSVHDINRVKCAHILDIDTDTAAL